MTIRVRDLIAAHVPAEWTSIHDLRRILAEHGVRSSANVMNDVVALVAAGLIEERGGAAGTGRSGAGPYSNAQYQIRLKGSELMEEKP